MANEKSMEDAMTRVFPDLSFEANDSRLQSSISLASTAVSDSTDSTAEYSTTSFGSSRSTICGLGMVSGRGIKRLGEVAIHGVETLVIRHRISAVDSFFPYRSSTDEHRAEQMCRDALELSRMGYYSIDIRRRALKAILAQIIYGDCHILLDEVTRWPFIELRLFIYSLLSAPLAQIMHVCGYRSRQSRLYSSAPCASRTVISYLREGPVTEDHWAKLYLFLLAISETSKAAHGLLGELDFHWITMRRESANL